MKKIVCILISIIMCFSCVISVSAQNTNTKTTVVSQDICDSIMNELLIYQNNKSLINMENVDFFNLNISEKICVYEYSQQGFEEIATAYILFENSNIVTLAFQSESMIFQFMGVLSEQISAKNQNNFCIVYDTNGCFIYNGEEFINLLLANDINDINRKSVTDAIEYELTELKLGNINNTQQLRSSNLIIPRAQSNFFCTVDYVTQNPYENLCWAACVAMVSNTLNDTSYSAVNIAMNYWGTSNFDRPLQFSIVTNIMNSEYGLGYNRSPYHPSDDAIYQNIINGYPLIGGFVSIETAHAVIIYGINMIAGRIVINDPIYGSLTCYLNGNGYYAYTTPGRGATIVLAENIRRIV